MDENKMIEDLVRMLDSGMSKGVGHVNVEYDAEEACSLPTLEQGLDDYQ